METTNSIEDRRYRLGILTHSVTRSTVQALSSEQQAYLASQLLQDDLKALALGLNFSLKSSFKIHA